MIDSTVPALEPDPYSWLPAGMAVEGPDSYRSHWAGWLATAGQDVHPETVLVRA